MRRLSHRECRNRAKDLVLLMMIGSSEFSEELCTCTISFSPLFAMVTTVPFPSPRNDVDHLGFFSCHPPFFFLICVVPTVVNFNCDLHQTLLVVTHENKKGMNALMSLG